MCWKKKKEDCAEGLYNKEREGYYNEAEFSYVCFKYHRKGRGVRRKDF